MGTGRRRSRSSRRPCLYVSSWGRAEDDLVVAVALAGAVLGLAGEVVAVGAARFPATDNGVGVAAGAAGEVHGSIEAVDDGDGVSVRHAVVVGGPEDELSQRRRRLPGEVTAQGAAAVPRAAGAEAGVGVEGAAGAGPDPSGGAARGRRHPEGPRLAGREHRAAAAAAGRDCGGVHRVEAPVVDVEGGLTGTAGGEGHEQDDDDQRDGSRSTHCAAELRL